MGSVLSRCTQEVSNVLRNCRSKGSRSEKEWKVLAEPQELHADQVEVYLLQSYANKIGKEDRTPVHDVKVSVCEQPAFYSEGNCRMARAGLHSTNVTGNCDTDTTKEASALGKEYIRRTYTLTPSNSHVGLSHAGTASMNFVTAVSTSETCCALAGADKVVVTERGEGNTEGPVDDWQRMWKANGSHGIAQTGGEEQVPERIRKLEQRQTKVLQDLCKLQEQVQSMAQQRGVDLSVAGEVSTQARGVTGVASQTQARGVTGVASQTQASPLQTQSGKLLDLVVSVDPDTVPLSLLVLLSQLSGQYRVLTTTYVHSSATTTPDRLRNFLQNGAQTSPRSNFQIALSVVWKKVPNGPRLMVSPIQQTHIEGEVNVARYLARLLQPAYDGGSIVQATLIDEILDMVQQQLITGNNKERAAVLRTLNARLGKSQFVVGSSLSLADVVAWSAVQGLQLASDAPNNVKHWLQACTQSKEFQTAVKFMSS